MQKDDVIYRRAAIDSLHGYFDGMLETDTWSPCDVYGLIEILPTAQPEQTNSWCINSWCINCKEYDTENKCCHRYNRVIKQTLDDAYRHGETEADARFHAQQRWIPCSERLPEEYGEYRITWVTSCAPSKRFIGDSEYEVTSVWDEERKDFKGEWLLDDYIKHYPDVKVIAWKPLEEPYQEEGD